MASIHSGSLDFSFNPSVAQNSCSLFENFSQSLKFLDTFYRLILSFLFCFFFTRCNTREAPFFLYRMSYLWYTWVGFLVAIIVGLLVSLVTGPNKYRVEDKKLYSPVIHRFLRKNSFTRTTVRLWID